VVPEPSAPPPAKEEKKLEKEKAETVDKPERGLAALLRRGQTQLKRGKFGAAAKTFREAVEADPKSADAHYGLGRALYDAGREPASQPHLERALALKPGLADIYVLLGAIYQSKGETEKAKKAYQTYLKKRPRGKYAKELQSVLQSM
jgi:Tfp pilus assembly protein PilF